MIPGADPQLTGPYMRLRASRYRRIAARMVNPGNPATGGVAQLFWKRKDDSNFAEARSVSVPVGNSGQWELLTFDMTSHPEWNGEIVQLRLDPVRFGDGHTIGIDYLRPLAGAVTPGAAPSLGMRRWASKTNAVVLWEAAPYRQFTLQRSTNLTVAFWEDVLENALYSDSVMTHEMMVTNRSGFFRVQVSPGP
jgi:hypothetical protein